MRLHSFKKHVLSTNHGNRKRKIKKFFNCKRTWKTNEKIKFRFIQEPWIYLLVKSRNSQTFYIINIMNFSKFAQEYFYLLVASLYLNPDEYLRWSILLRTLCNYSRFRGPIYSKLSHIQNPCVSAIP